MILLIKYTNFSLNLNVLFLIIYKKLNIITKMKQHFIVDTLIIKKIIHTKRISG
jgi:hypothetical protein